MRLHPGNLALIASDGVIPEKDDGWLRNLLSANNGSSMKDLARDTLKEALKQYGCIDDMTVLAVRIDQRK